ncbi:uncharacterized protein VTP21DRAFT_6999 [Calcarisporiella thermophila]|uniref:uncharacterized protein n=1 Tax=Calcarisporiella thermophila TaxID=911321 RepID=UPI0037446E60
MSNLSRTLPGFIQISPRMEQLLAKLEDFVTNDCIPAEKLARSQLGTGENRWKIVPPVLHQLKEKAKSLGLWNLFLPQDIPGSPGLSNVEYALCAEIMGRSVLLAPEACNCSAPDTGNMELLARCGNEEQKRRWLEPLLRGEIRSAFAMTEKNVASSDATNVQTRIERQGNEYVINGHKWWISGAGNPECKVFLVMGKTDPSAARHKQQSVVIVPAGTPGLTIVRPMEVFGYDDAPEGHCEVTFENVRVPVENVLLGEGRGFELAQTRLGPGRLHHCMRAIGVAERALELMLLRVTDESRKTFGKLLVQHGTVLSWVAQSRMDIDQARLLVLNAAAMVDRDGAKAARKAISVAKIVVPNAVLRVLDRAIQAFGAGGVSQDFPLAQAYAMTRTLRIADGPDEVHQLVVGGMELRRVPELRSADEQRKAREQEIFAKAKL